MKSNDELILESIKNDFKTVREISEELGIAYTRVSVRIKGLRKTNSVISVQSFTSSSVGVKPLKYKRQK